MSQEVDISHVKQEFTTIITHIPLPKVTVQQKFFTVSVGTFSFRACFLSIQKQKKGVFSRCVSFLSLSLSLTLSHSLTLSLTLSLSL
jgi:hypothetical protein